MTNQSDSVGERVAELRRERGMSQRELAEAVSRSEGWVSQVERGVQPVHRLPMLQMLADALGVTVQELSTRAPKVNRSVNQLSGASSVSNDLDAVRLMLSGHPTVAQTDRKEHPPTLEAFEDATDKAWNLANNGLFVDLSRLLNTLIPDLEHAVRTSVPKDVLVLNRYRYRAYQAASEAFSRQYEPDAAWVAADRSLAAAELSDEPLAVYAGHFRLAHAFLRAKRADQAEGVAKAAISSLEAKDEWIAEPEGASVLGALYLVAAVIAARTENREDAKHSLNRAEEIAGDIPDGRNDFNTEFGMTNVLLHKVAVAVELGDAGEALELASHISAEKLSVERQTRLLIDVAAAHLQRHRLPSALESLLKAESMSPDFIHGHPYPRELIGKLLRLQVVPNTRLVDLADRANVQVSR